MDSWAVLSRKAGHQTLETDGTLCAFKELSGQGYKCGRKYRAKSQAQIKWVYSIISGQKNETPTQPRIRAGKVIMKVVTFELNLNT